MPVAAPGARARGHGILGRALLLNASHEPLCVVPMRRAVKGRETLLAIDHARKLLAYEPAHRWEDHVSAT